MSRQHVRRAISCGLFCGLLCVTTIGSATTVRLKNQASVSGTIIRLGDVAEITEFDAKKRKALEAIKLGPSPATGSEVRLDYAAIKSRLKSLGLDLSRIDFSGRSIVRITRVGKPSKVQLTTFTPNRRVVVSSVQQQRAEKLVANAISQLLRRQKSDLGGVNVSVTIRPEDVAGVLNAARLEYGIRGLQSPKLGVHQLTVAFLDRGERLHKVPVSCRLSNKPYVWAARYPLRKGLIIQSSDLVQKQVDDLKKGFTEIEHVVGLEVIRPISRDAVITTTDIRRVIVVKANDVVRVVSRRGRISVARAMKARQSGAVGDQILCVELKGRGEVRARVTGRYQAEVISTAKPRLAVLRDHSGSIEFRKVPKADSKSAPTKPSNRRNSSGRTEPEWRSLDSSASTRSSRVSSIRPVSNQRLSNRPSLEFPPVPRR